MSSRHPHSKKHNQSHTRLLHYLHKAPNTEKGVIFDIGTRAIRILCGPKDIPQMDWDRNLFFNDGILTNLGTAVTPQNHLPINSPALQKLISFIKKYQAILQQNGLSIDDCLGFGTAVFRWLTNREEIIEHIKKQTNLTINVLSQQEEALFALIGLVATHKMRGKNNKKRFGKNDVLMLLDQGGGSLEVSYAFVNNFHKKGVYSFDDLGSIALRKRFLSIGADNVSIDPHSNPNEIATQHQQTLQYITNRITNWQGYPELQGRKIYAYAMGSAASRILNKSTYEMHNSLINTQQIQKKINTTFWNSDQKKQPISTLYQNFCNQSNGGKSKYEDKLLLLYGLPVYLEALKKFNLKSMRFCGYGLRYGVFTGIYRWKINPNEIKTNHID